MIANSLNWTPQQLAFFNELLRGEGHVVLEALAGTGKTTTIAAAVQQLPYRAKILVGAFNKRAAGALEAKVKRYGTDIRTWNAFGFETIRRHHPRVVLDENRGRRLLTEALGNGRKAPVELTRFLGLLKGKLLLKPEEILEALMAHAIQLPRGLGIGDAAFALDQALQKSLEWDGTVDFDDQVFVPLMSGMQPELYDYVFVDEAQDLNLAQLALASSALNEDRKARFIAVGDRNQAIYGWRGADSTFMSDMERSLGAKVLPLSVTFRCPRKVVQLAQIFVPTIEAAPNAVDGRIFVRTQGDWQPGDAVLSRVNAPLVRLALQVIARPGGEAHVRGKSDVADRLSSWIQMFKADATETLLGEARRWVERRIEHLKKSEEPDEEELSRVNDQWGILSALAERTTRVSEILDRLKMIFADDNGRGVVFSSVHQAKGLEWPRVFLLSSTFRPRRSTAEAAIAYVAITRAMRELTFVVGGEEIKDDLMRSVVFTHAAALADEPAEVVA